MHQKHLGDSSEDFYDDIFMVLNLKLYWSFVYSQYVFAFMGFVIKLLKIAESENQMIIH